MSEQPYPDMTDRDALEKLLPIAQDLIETDRAKGDILYEIFKYLELRFDGDPAGAREFEKKVQLHDPEIQETVREAMDWQGGTITIFTNCHIESVTIKSE